VELNPPGNDNYKSVEEWIELYNPTSKDVDISGWTISTTHGRTVTITIPKGTIIKGKSYLIIARGAQWLDNEDESIVLRDDKGNIVDMTPTLSDPYNDGRSWQRYPNGKDTNSRNDWVFKWSTKGDSNGGEEPEQKEEPRSEEEIIVEVDVIARVYKVIDGDTFDAFPVGRVRLADIDAPEYWEEGYEEAREFLESLVLNKKVYLDVDDESVMDRYNRLVCIVYVEYNSTHLLNVNFLLVRKGYAEISDYLNEFNPSQWKLYVYCPEIGRAKAREVVSLEEYQKLMKALKELNSTYSKLLEKYERLVINYTKLMNDYRGILRMYEALEEKYKGLFKEYQTYLRIAEEKLRRLREEVERLTSECTILANRVKQLEGERESLAKEKMALRKEVFKYQIATATSSVIAIALIALVVIGKIQFIKRSSFN